MSIYLSSTQAPVPPIGEWMGRALVPGLLLGIVVIAIRAVQPGHPLQVRVALLAAIVLPALAVAVGVWIGRQGHPLIGIAVALNVVSILPAVVSVSVVTRALAGVVSALLIAASVLVMTAQAEAFAAVFQFAAGVAVALPQIALAIWGLIRAMVTAADPALGVARNRSSESVPPAPSAPNSRERVNVDGAQTEPISRM
jgi:hypothetical protein